MNDAVFWMVVITMVCAGVALTFSVGGYHALSKAKAAEAKVDALADKMATLWAAHGRVVARHDDEFKVLDGAVTGLKARVSSLEKKAASLSKQIKDEGVARFSGEALQKGWMSDIRARVRALETGEPDGFVFPEDGFGMDLAMEQECAKASSKAKAPKAVKTAKPAGRSKKGGA